jgi:hypothetical protein
LKLPTPIITRSGSRPGHRNCKTVDKIDFDNVDTDNMWRIADAGLIHPEFQ